MFFEGNEETSKANYDFQEGELRQQQQQQQQQQLLNRRGRLRGSRGKVLRMIQRRGPKHNTVAVAAVHNNTVAVAAVHSNTVAVAAVHSNTVAVAAVPSPGGHKGSYDEQQRPPAPGGRKWRGQMRWGRRRPVR
jgi:hypothetical protein